MGPVTVPLPSARPLAWAVVRRVVWAALVVYGVVSAMFVLLVLAPDYTYIAALWARARQGEMVEAQDPPPLTEQYVDWMVSVFTLQWGESETALQRGAGEFGGASNFAVVADALSVTATYAVPATVLAFLLAMVLGYYAARRPDSWLDRTFTGSTYLAFSVPNFFLAAILFYTLRDLQLAWFPASYDTGAGITVDNLVWLALPGFVLVGHLVAGLFRYSRAQVHDALAEQYVALAESKGVGSLRLARHVFRNAAMPMVTLFVSELLGVALVTLFVIEAVFEVPGIGALAFDAVRNQDVDLIMILTGLFATAVVLANLLEDLAYLALDPRIDR